MAETVAIARRGQVTIPKSLRDKFGIQDGQRYAIRVLEGGVVVLTPRAEKAVAAIKELGEVLRAKGATGDAMLAEVRRMREENDD